MYKNIENYKGLEGDFIGVFRYIEGDDKESFWIDFQNCMYYTYCKNYDDDTHLLGGKNWWILWPHIPKNDDTIIKNDDGTSNVVWFVDDSSIETDIEKEWDFNNHKPYNYEENTNSNM